MAEKDYLKLNNLFIGAYSDFNNRIHQLSNRERPLSKEDIEGLKVVLTILIDARIELDGISEPKKVRSSPYTREG